MCTLSTCASSDLSVTQKNVRKLTKKNIYSSKTDKKIQKTTIFNLLKTQFCILKQKECSKTFFELPKMMLMR